MKFTAAAAALLFSTSALAAPKASSSVVLKVSSGNVANDAKVASYIGKDGFYATFQNNQATNIAFTKDAKKAEQFKMESGGAETVLKGSHGYLTTTIAPQGFGGVLFQKTVNKNVQVNFSPGPDNNRHLTDREDLFNSFMFCYAPEGASLYWTKIGLNIENYNKALPDQGAKAYRCAFVSVDVVDAKSCH